VELALAMARPPPVVELEQALAIGSRLALAIGSRLALATGFRKALAIDLTPRLWRAARSGRLE
jgi:hypothetical protein